MLFVISTHFTDNQLPFHPNHTSRWSCLVTVSHGLVTAASLYFWVRAFILVTPGHGLVTARNSPNHIFNCDKSPINISWDVCFKFQFWREPNYTVPSPTNFSQPAQVLQKHFSIPATSQVSRPLQNQTGSRPWFGCRPQLLPANKNFITLADPCVTARESFISTSDICALCKRHHLRLSLLQNKINS